MDSKIIKLEPLALYKATLNDSRTKHFDSKEVDYPQTHLIIFFVIYCRVYDDIRNYWYKTLMELFLNNNVSNKGKKNSSNKLF